MRISWRNSSKKQKRGQYGTHLESSAKMKSCSFTLKGAFRQLASDFSQKKKKKKKDEGKNCGILP